MSERKATPILMQPDMVRATLREIRNPGTGKWMTRRGFKLPPNTLWYDDLGGEKEGWLCDERISGGWCHVDELACPYGMPGDLLYVRETWKPDTDNDISTICYRADGAHVPIKNTQKAAERWVSLRRPEEQWPDLKPPKWRPGIHMPRWANRITLELTDVRVERVQDITYGEILKEGLDYRTDEIQTDSAHMAEARREFEALWNRINESRGYGWDTNPWVWVLSYRPHLINVDEFIKQVAA